MSETKEFKRSYFEESDFLSNFANVSITLDCYRGKEENPKWMDVDAGELLSKRLSHYFLSLATTAERYSTLCKINVDLSKMGKALGPYKGADGRIFYKANFDIVLLFGLTELKAQVCWKEKVRLRLELTRYVHR